MSKTFISSDMSVEGDISSQSDIEVDGKVKGNLSGGDIYSIIWLGRW